MPIDDDEKQFWVEQFKSLEVNWQAVIKEAKDAAREYGAIAANVDRFINRKFYQEPKFWIHFAVGIAILCVLGVIVNKGGEIKILDWIEVSLPPPM